MEHTGMWGPPQSSCTLTGVLHEQGPSWSTLDFGGAPKLSHHFLRRAYAPLLLWGRLNQDAGRVTVHLISDLAHPIAGQCGACRAE